MQEVLERIQEQMQHTQRGGCWLHQRRKRRIQEHVYEQDHPSLLQVSCSSKQTSHGAAEPSKDSKSEQVQKVRPREAYSSLKDTTAGHRSTEICCFFTQPLKSIFFFFWKSWTFCCSGVTVPSSGQWVVVTEYFCTFFCFCNDKNETEINRRHLTTSIHDYTLTTDVL